MEDVWIWIAVLLVGLLIGGRLVLSHAGGGVTRTIGFVVAWLVVTAVALVTVHAAVLLVTTLILFSAGPELAMVGAALSVVALVVTPILCAMALRRGFRWLWADRQPNA